MKFDDVAADVFLRGVSKQIELGAISAQNRAVRAHKWSGMAPFSKKSSRSLGGEFGSAVSLIVIRSTSPIRPNDYYALALKKFPVAINFAQLFLASALQRKASRSRPNRRLERAFGLFVGRTGDPRSSAF